MQCPQCKDDTEVKDSRARPYGVRRRRECVKCQHRFTTVEVELHSFHRIRSLLQQVLKLVPNFRKDSKR